MKKKVRIYKAPDGKGKYINKTAKFLYGGIPKAQAGGTQAQATPDVKKYMQYAYGQLSNDMPPEDVYSDLVTGGLSQEMALAVLNQVMTLMIQNGELDPDYMKNKNEDTQSTEQQDQQSSMQGQQQMANAEEEAQQAQSREQNALAMPEEGDMDDEEAYLEDTSHMMPPEEEEEEYYRGGYMQDGGQNQMMAQFENMKKPSDRVTPLDELIESTPGIQEGLTFPGIESYLPDYRSVDWEPIQALSPMPEAKKGGAANKKSFVKNVMALVKRANGGEGADPSAEEKSNKERGKGNPMDTYTNDVEKMKSGFIGRLKENASKAASEKLYDTLSSSQDPQHQQMAQALSQSMNNPQQPQQQPAMQTGGEKPDWYTGYNNMMSPHQYRQYYRMLKKLLPRELRNPRIAASMYDRNMAPPFVTPESGSLRGNLSTPTSKLDLLRLISSQMGIPTGNTTFPFIQVEDTDIFGRPKKYYIDYNGRRSAQLQADEVEAVNNSKYAEITPFNIEEAVDYPMMEQDPSYDMIDSPVTGDDMYQDYAQFGGFTGGENPLTRFVYGGDEPVYYEDDYLPEAKYGLSTYEGGGKVDVVSENPKIYVAKDGAGNIVYRGEDQAAANAAIAEDETPTNTETKTEVKAEPKKEETKTTTEPTVRKANVRYVPRRVTTPGGFYRTVAPWNPFAAYAGSWARQMGSPFIAGTNTPFAGSMEGMTPAARHVLETTMLRRRPKEWIDYYQSPGTGGGTMYRGSDGNLHFLNSNIPDMAQEQNQANELTRRYAPGTKYNIPMEEWDALSSNARSAIRRGERQARGNARRYTPGMFDNYVPGPKSVDTDMMDSEAPEMLESPLSPEQRDYLKKSLTLPDRPLQEDFLEVPYTGPVNEELEQQRYGGLPRAQSGFPINLDKARLEFTPFSYNYSNPQGQTIWGKKYPQEPTYRIGVQAPIRSPRDEGYHTLNWDVGLPYSGKLKPSTELRYDYYNKPSLGQSDVQLPYVQVYSQAGYDPVEKGFAGMGARTYYGWGTAKPSTKSKGPRFGPNDWWSTLGPVYENNFGDIQLVDAEGERFLGAKDKRLIIDPEVAWGLKGDFEWRPGKTKNWRLGARYGVMFDPIEGKNMEYQGSKPNSEDRLQFAINPQLEVYGNYGVDLWPFESRAKSKKLSDVKKTTGTTSRPSPNPNKTTGTNTNTDKEVIDGIPVEKTIPEGEDIQEVFIEDPCPEGYMRYEPGGKCHPITKSHHPRWLQSGGSMLDKYQTQGQVNPFASGQQCPPGYFKDPSTGLCKNFAGQIAPAQMNTAPATANQLMNNPMQATGTNTVTGQDYMFTNQQGQLQKNNLNPQGNFNRNPQTVGVRYKKEDMRTIDPEAMLNVANAGFRGLEKGINSFRGRNDERDMIMEETGINSFMPTQQPQHRGDWLDFGSMAGQYRFDQMGQDRSGFSSYGQRGGYMQQGGAYDFAEGDEVMMTPEELEEFIANGGQVEYI